MTVWAYLQGIAVIAAMVVPVATACRLVRAKALPDRTGSQALLADLVMGIATLTLLAQLLGAVGLFRRWPMAVACIAAGAAARAWARRMPTPAPTATPTAERPGVRPSSSRTTAAALTIAALVGAHWMASIGSEVRHGIADVDSLAYHSPFAARFVQDGRLTGLHFASGNATFYPANGELVQAMAILPFGRDPLAPLVNLGWLALALLAGWCIGRPFGAAPTSLAGVALVVSSPLLIRFDAGTAGNDVAALALVLAAVALLASTRWRPAEVALAGAAVGLALGTKLNVVPPLGLLLVAVPLVMPAARRRKQAVVWVLSAVLLGSSWYLRNLATTGNPLPWLRIGVPPLALPQLRHLDSAQRLGVPLAEYARSSEHWPEIVAGLDDGLGPGWPLVLLLAVTGLAIGVGTARTSVHRLLAGFGVAVAVTHAYNPLSAGGLPGGGFFAINLRYAAPALAVGFVALAIAPPLAGARRQVALLAAYAGVIAITARSYGAEQSGDVVGRVHPVVVGVIVGVGALAPLYGGRITWRADRHRRRAVVAVAATLGIGAGWVGQRQFLETRYRHPPAGSAISAADVWAQDISQAHIALAGQALYPLYGADLSNRVDSPRLLLERGDSAGITRCTQWRRALADGGFDHVVIHAGALSYGMPREVVWTLLIPGTTPVVSDEVSWVFRLPAESTRRPCP